MRIGYANIPTRASQTPSPVTTGKSTSPQVNEPRDSFKPGQSSSQVIDAEFVEFYTPSTEVFDKERQNLDTTLAAGQVDKADTASRTASLKSEHSPYRLDAHNPPPPGTYIDYYA